MCLLSTLGLPCQLDVGLAVSIWRWACHVNLTLGLPCQLDIGLTTSTWRWTCRVNIGLALLTLDLLHRCWACLVAWARLWEFVFAFMVAVVCVDATALVAFTFAVAIMDLDVVAMPFAASMFGAPHGSPLTFCTPLHLTSFNVIKCLPTSLIGGERHAMLLALKESVREPQQWV